MIAFVITNNVFLFSPSFFPTSVIASPSLSRARARSHLIRDLTINVSSSSICLFVSLMRGVEIDLPPAQTLLARRRRTSAAVQRSLQPTLRPKIEIIMIEHLQCGCRDGRREFSAKYGKSRVYGRGRLRIFGRACRDICALIPPRNFLLFANGAKCGRRVP